MATRQHQVIMFPWLAFGHMLPFLEFSKSLAAKGISVIFVSTPRNIQRLPPIPPNLADQIKLVEIPLPSVDGLPECCEATIDLPLEKVQYLKKAYDQMQAPFERLLQQISPDLVLCDFMPCWIPEMASKFGVPSAFFSVFSAATLAFIGPPLEVNSGSRRKKPEDFTISPEWFTFPSLVAFRPEHAARTFRNLNFPDVTGMSTGHRWAKTIEDSEFVAVRSCREFEGEYVDLLQELYQKPVLPVGLLPPQRVEGTTSTAGEAKWSNIFRWLNSQAPKSVVFVGFGSEYKITINQVHELAIGLELSQLPFIWALRKPEGVNSSDLFPLGFDAQNTSRGLVYTGWAPQLDILAHPAIGGCLFHSGWGSIVESLSYGHPLILLPMIADQGLNARVLVEKGIGLEVARNEDGSFTRYQIAKFIRLVMLDPEGEPLRLKAAQMQTIFANQELHEDCINRFIQHLYRCKRRDHPYISNVTSSYV